MGYSDTDVAEYLYTSKPDIKSLVNYLCKDLSKACSTKPPPVLKVTAFPVWKLNIIFQSIMYASLKTMTWQSQRFCLSSYLMIFSVFKLRWNLVLVQSSLVYFSIQNCRSESVGYLNIPGWLSLNHVFVVFLWYLRNMSVRDCENEDFGRKTRVKCHVKRMMRVEEENEDETDMPKKCEVFCSNISVDLYVR